MNKKVLVESGMSGHMSSSVAPMTDNLVSTVAMMSLGYQFWFGECPYMITPDGDEVLLYQKTNGYLCLKVTPMTGEQVSQLMPPPKMIGWVTNDIDLWHERCCHMSEEPILKSVKEGLVRGIPDLCRHKKNGSEPICLACGLGKSSRQHVGPNVYRDKAKMESYKKEKSVSSRDMEVDPYQELEQLHVDMCEMDAEDLYGNRWFLVIVDRATKFTWCIPMKDKEDVTDTIEVFIAKVVRPYHRRMGKIHPHLHFSGLQTLRSDSGTEFQNAQMKALAARCGFELSPIAPYVNDGRAEAAIKSLVTLTRCCLLSANLRKPFWSSIMEMVCHTMNRMYSDAEDCKGVPYTKLYGKIPDVSYFRQPGCIALVHKMDKDRRKLDEKVRLCKFIG